MTSTHGRESGLRYQGARRKNNLGSRGEDWVLCSTGAAMISQRPFESKQQAVPEPYGSCTPRLRLAYSLTEGLDQANHTLPTMHRFALPTRKERPMTASGWVDSYFFAFST